MEQRILDRRKRLMEIASRLTSLDSIEERVAYLQSVSEKKVDLEGKNPWEQILALSLAILDEDEKKLGDGSEVLTHVEEFYRSIGGVIGYVAKFLELFYDKSESAHAEYSYEAPEGKNLQDPETYLSLTSLGLEVLPKVAAIFPVGGAGDRLNLHDPKTGEPLPAAVLQFNGAALLTGLFVDLEGLEYLYEKVYGEKIRVPIVLMTSREKDNHEHIFEICERNHWFGRQREDVMIVVQPLVPVITSEGKFALNGDGKLKLKPGGHGVIWKLASDFGVIQKIIKSGIHHAFLRQINNPIAGLDGNILALIGEGFRRGGVFGSISCKRIVDVAEGMVVLREKEGEYSITNIEYTDFVHAGIEDVPEEPDSPYSRFPSNTNILFVDLQAVNQSIAKNPLPGLLLNVKGADSGRLETIMQNIADELVFPSKESVKSFVLFNERVRTISTAKQLEGKEQTPMKAFSDLQKNMRILFIEHCGFELAPAEKIGEFPTHLIRVHPTLGPLFGVIAQKIQGGRFAKGSELMVDSPEVEIRDLDLEGSLLIRGAGSCELLQVTVRNEGIDRDNVKEWWTGSYTRKGLLEIVVEEGGEFSANGVHFEGGQTIKVPRGMRVEATSQGLIETPIDHPPWQWYYDMEDDGSIVLTK